MMGDFCHLSVVAATEALQHLPFSKGNQEQVKRNNIETPPEFNAESLLFSVQIQVCAP